MADAGALTGAVLVARGDTVLYQGAFGPADPSRGIPWTVSTPSAVASIAKPFTIIMIYQLMEAGRLRLTDTVVRWVPELPEAGRITIGMLMSHRAGIRHRVTTTADEQVPQTPATMMPRIAASSLLFEPGSQRAYSSMGYVVLARILELVTGKAYHQLLRELVLEPAGAIHSADAGDPAGFDAGAVPFQRIAADHLPGTIGEFSFLTGAGGLWSTNWDLRLVFRRLLAGGFGTAARARLVPSAAPTVWNGWTGGYRAVLQYDPRTGVLVSLTTNQMTGAGDLAIAGLGRLALGEEVASPVLPAPRVVELGDGVRRQIEGPYLMGPEQQVPLQFRNASLAQLGDYLLLPTSDSTLFSIPDYAEVRLVRGADGRVTALQWGAQGPRFNRPP
jgi:CubicO group peptidase (beta-lactamase class C family)